MIRVMAPDLPAMSGGMRVMYDMVAALEHSGRPARIWHARPGYAVPGLEGVAPVECAPVVTAEPGDILVMSEFGGTEWSGLNPAVPTVMLVQAIDFMILDAGFAAPVPGVYPGWPQVHGAIVVSDAVEEYVRMLCPDLEVHRVPIQIDTARFAPAEKERLVTFMPRRRPLDQLAGIQLLHRRGRFRDWRLEPIERMTHDQVGQALARSAIFLAGGEREGFGLPAAEAMSAGAHVVGWSGHGGREFLLPDLATTVEDSDVVSMALGVEAAMYLFDHDRPAFDARAAAGRRLIEERYGADGHDRAVLAAFDALAAPDSPSVVRRPMQVRHIWTRMPRPSVVGRSYLAARTAAGRARRAWRRR